EQDKTTATQGFLEGGGMQFQAAFVFSQLARMYGEAMSKGETVDSVWAAIMHNPQYKDLLASQHISAGKAPLEVIKDALGQSTAQLSAQEQLTLQLTKQSAKWTEWATDYWKHYDEANLIIAEQLADKQAGRPIKEPPNWMKPGGQPEQPERNRPPTPYEKQMAAQRNIAKEDMYIGSYAKLTAKGVEQVLIKAEVRHHLPPGMLMRLFKQESGFGRHTL